MTYHTPELVLVGSAQGLVLAGNISDAGVCPLLEVDDIRSRNEAEF